VSTKRNIAGRKFLVLVTLIAGATSATMWPEIAGAGAFSECPSGPPPYEAENLPREVPPECNLEGKVVRDYALGATVGPRGTAVFADAHGDLGYQEFGIETRTDGSVVFHLVGNESNGDGASNVDDGSGSSSPGACNDSAYNLDSYEESDQHQWRIKTSSLPGYLDATTTIESIRDGVRNITNAYNDCGRSDFVGATADYLGSTSASANIDSDGNCVGYFSKDEINVADFGYIKSGYVGWACSWYALGELHESDIRFASRETWTNNPGSSCSGKYDIASVATHERGHTFGLNHVSEADHAHLTMSTKIPKCSENPRTLGLGDMYGLEQKY